MTITTRGRSRRGRRKPVIVDGMVLVLVSALVSAGFGFMDRWDLAPEELLVAAAALFGPLALAVAYGAVNAAESRRDWVGANVAGGLVYFGMILASIGGLVVLTACCPPAALTMIAGESLLLLWAVTWV